MPDLEQAPFLLGHVYYSRKYNCMYVGTPKVASSTIKHTLQRAEAGAETEGDGHSRDNPYGYSDFLLRIHDNTQNSLRVPNDWPQLQDFLCQSCLAFCFVRNPYTRILSAYIDKIRVNPARRSFFMRELGVANPDPDEIIGFVEFLKLIERQAPAEANAHWRQQRFHLVSDEIPFGFIGCFERFAADFADVCSRISPRLQGFIQTVDEHKTNAKNIMTQYYSQQKAVSLVRDIYHIDFDSFSYSDDIERFNEPFGS